MLVWVTLEFSKAETFSRDIRVLRNSFIWIFRQYSKSFHSLACLYARKGKIMCGRYLLIKKIMCGRYLLTSLHFTSLHVSTCYCTSNMVCGWKFPTNQRILKKYLIFTRWYEFTKYSWSCHPCWPNWLIFFQWIKSIYFVNLVRTSGCTPIKYSVPPLSMLWIVTLFEIMKDEGILYCSMWTNALVHFLLG